MIWVIFLKKTNIKDKINANFTIIITQIIFCLLVLIIIICIRLLGGELNNNFTHWYYENVRDKTDINQVLYDEMNLGNDLLVLSQSALKDSNNFISPLNTQGTVTSRFGYRHDPINGEYKLHKGLDIAAEKGSGIVSVFNGSVVQTGYDDGYGNFIIVDHNNGLKTLYAHCDTIIANCGDVINQGEIIATVGSSGRSTGNHLHFEIIKNDIKIDPLWIIG